MQPELEAKSAAPKGWLASIKDGFEGFTGRGAAREGSPWTGLGAVVEREFNDNLTSVRMRVLQAMVFFIGFGAAFAAIGQIKDLVGEDPFLFLKIFTVAREGYPSFLTLLSLFIPIVAIALGFDSINGEFGRRTMSRILAQPIYRDALLVGKFLAGLATLSVFLLALWLFMMGLGLLMFGLAPNGEEIVRSVLFLVAAIAYGGIWLAIAMFFSTVFKSTATSALVTLALWLLLLFWPFVARGIAEMISPIDPFDPRTQIAAYETQQAIERLSPNTLFSEAATALLNPSTRTFGLVMMSELRGMVRGAPLPLMQSLLLIWPQLAGLIASLLLLFALAYIAFQRQEVRA